MILDSTTEKITLVLAGATTTAPGDIYGSWTDSDSAASPKFNAGSATATTSGTSSVDVVPVPGASTARRSVEEISVVNTDTQPMTVTIRHSDGATHRKVFGPCTIQVGEKIQFKAKDGWKVFTVAGAVKVTAVQSTVEPGYIDGMKMIWNSATSLTIDSGSCYIPSVGANVNFSAQTTKAGLALSANTWYHVYAFLNSGVPDVEIVTTAPSSPYNGTARTKTGDTTRRYIGSIRAGAGGSILQFLQSNTYIGYLYDSVGTGRVLAAGVATVVTAVSLANLVPVTSRVGQVNITNGTPAQSVFTRSPDQPAAGGVAGPFLFMALTQQAFGSVAHPLSSAQALEYFLSAVPPSGGAYIDVVGYLYER